MFKLALISTLVLFTIGGSYTQNPKTVDDIISRLQSQGEKVQIIASATDAFSNMTWIVLQREGQKPGKRMFSLIKTIGGGADGVVDNANLVNTLQEYTDMSIAISLVQQIVDRNIQTAGGPQRMQEQISRATKKEPNVFNGMSELVLSAYAARGIQIPR